MSTPRRFIEDERQRRRLGLDLPTRRGALPAVLEYSEELEPELPTRRIPSASLESNVVEFPSRRPASLAEAEVPLDLPTYRVPNDQVLTSQNQQTITRPRTTQTIPAPAEDIESLPTRPRLVHPKGTVEYQDRLLTDLENGPGQKFNRKQSAKYGFLRGLASGGLAGAAVGALVGAISPGATSDMKKRDDVAKATASLDTAIQREGRRSVIEERRRQPQKEFEAALRTEREKRIANLMTMHDRAGHYNPDDPNDRSSQIIRAQAEALGVADQLVPYSSRAGSAPPRVNVDGTEYERQADGSWKPATGLPSRSMVIVPGYGPMTPAQARQADAIAGERVYQRARDESLDTRHEQERFEQRRQAASRIAGEVAAHNAEAAKWKDLAARTTDQMNKDYYESQVLGEKEKANAKALELAQGYGDIYEAGPGEGGWAYVKPKPQASRALPTRGSKPGRIQSNEDPDIRAYANQYFNGDYRAALRAIQNQRRH